VQPWHPSSTLTHEASLAVGKLDREKLWSFSAALFEHQLQYFDVSVVHETRNQTYARLASLAESCGINKAKLLDLLLVPNAPKDGAYNLGNAVTDDLKLLVKEARQRSIHVSPTVVFNGTIEASISSSWTKEDWSGWLKTNVQ